MEIKTENLAWRRASALVWDHLILTFGSIFILLPTITNLSEPVTSPEQLMAMLWSNVYTIPAMIVIFVLMIFYEPFCTYKYGWTIGKKMSSLKVVDREGKQLSFFLSLVRFIIKSACITVPYLNFVLIIMSYARQVRGQKMLWDEWLGTNVIQQP